MTKTFRFAEVCIINWGLSRANFKLMQRLIWELHVENPIFTVIYSIKKKFSQPNNSLNTGGVIGPSPATKTTGRYARAFF